MPATVLAVTAGSDAGCLVPWYDWSLLFGCGDWLFFWLRCACDEEDGDDEPPLPPLVPLLPANGCAPEPDEELDGLLPPLLPPPEGLPHVLVLPYSFLL